MPPRQSRPPTLESLLPPILDNLKPPSPNAYSAHQKALTTTARLAAARHHALAIQIAFESAKELLKLGEAGSGVDLGVRMIGFMSDGEVGVTDMSRGELAPESLQSVCGACVDGSQRDTAACAHAALGTMEEEARGLGGQVVDERGMPDGRSGSAPLPRGLVL